MAKLSLYYPLKPVQDNQPFGVNWGANYPLVLGTLGHPGQDLVNIVNGVNHSFGMPITASHNGTVLSLEEDTNGGFVVVLLTDQAYDYKDTQVYFKTIYAHCQTGSFKVKQGDTVKVGDVLALCGASGVIPNQPENPIHAHVHFGIKPTIYVTHPDPKVDGLVDPFWKNIEDANGYHGAIDPEPYWNHFFAEDVPKQLLLITLLQKVVELYKKLIHG